MTGEPKSDVASVSAPQASSQASKQDGKVEDEFGYALAEGQRDEAFAKVAYAPSESPHLVSDITNLPLQAVRESEEGEVDSEQSHASGSQHHSEASSDQAAAAAPEQTAPVSTLEAIVAGALQRETAREASPRSANDALAAAAQNQAEMGSNFAEPPPIEQVIISNKPPKQPAPSTTPIKSSPNNSSSAVPGIPPRSPSPVAHIIEVSPREHMPTSVAPLALLPQASFGNASEVSNAEDGRTPSCGMNLLGSQGRSSGAVGDSMGTLGDSSVFHQAYNVEFPGALPPHPLPASCNALQVHAAPPLHSCFYPLDRSTRVPDPTNSSACSSYPGGSA